MVEPFLSGIARRFYCVSFIFLCDFGTSPKFYSSWHQLLLFLILGLTRNSILQDFGMDPKIEERGHVLRGLAFAETSFVFDCYSTGTSFNFDCNTIFLRFFEDTFCENEYRLFYGPSPWTMRYKAETSFLPF